MMEREPRPRTFTESINDQFGLNLSERIRSFQEVGDTMGFERYMEMMEGLLIEGGVEMNDDQLVRLQNLLKQHAREIGITDEEK